MNTLQQLFDTNSDYFLHIDESMISLAEDDLTQQIDALEQGTASLTAEGIALLQQCLKSKAMLQQLKMDFTKWNGATTH